jgi:phosphotriesterase-related protein
MSDVQTVRGPIDTVALGKVLMHEHVFVVGTELRQNYPETWDEEVRVADAVAKLTELKARGVDTIVDPTVIGLGRYVPRIQRINEQVDINIVAATGLYTYNDLPFQFHFAGPGLMFDMTEPLVEMFLQDIREGIAGTGVRDRGCRPDSRCRASDAGGRPGTG